jgi:hypothetical protein
LLFLPFSLLAALLLVDLCRRYSWAHSIHFHLHRYY